VTVDPGAQVVVERLCSRHEHDRAAVSSADVDGQGAQLVTDVIMQLTRYSPALIFLSPHETGSQRAYFVAAIRQVRYELTFDFPGALDLSDVFDHGEAVDGLAIFIVDKGCS